MRRYLLWQQILFFTTLFVLCSGQLSCFANNRILQCNVTDSFSTIDVGSQRPDNVNSINIKYRGNVVLNLTSSLTIPIVIEPIDVGNHTLQISRIDTAAIRTQINIGLSTSQVAQPLFSNSCSIIALKGTIAVNVVQNISDASDFKIFAPSSTTTMNFDKFELTVDSTSSNVGNLYLPYLILGLTNLTSVAITGSNHKLVANQNNMPQTIKIYRLSLKQLYLADKILYNFYNLKEYYIEKCTFNRASLFLNATPVVNVSLTLKNNNPTDSVLPFGSGTFSLSSFGRLISLTIIEPKLNSSSLYAIKSNLYLSKIFISLGSYHQKDMKRWSEEKPIFKYLTIENINDLNIFPPVFFNYFYGLAQVILRGNFTVRKDDILSFVGITKDGQSDYPIVTLDTTENNMDNCTKAYITGINTKSINDIWCETPAACRKCKNFGEEIGKCNFTAYETSVASKIDHRQNAYYYNGSILYSILESLSCSPYPTTTSKESNKSDAYIGAIIGAVCGLVLAAIVLGITVYCICQKRNKYESKYAPSAPQIKVVRSSFDASNVSIATSKTSNSSRYALEKSFFPSIQPNDQIVPPLYTAPSESVGSTSNYKSPSAPPARRDSVSTHTTHVYETLYS